MLVVCWDILLFLFRNGLYALYSSINHSSKTKMAFKYVFVRPVSWKYTLILFRFPYRGMCGLSSSSYSLFSSRSAVRSAVRSTNVIPAFGRRYMSHHVQKRHGYLFDLPFFFCSIQRYINHV